MSSSAWGDDPDVGFELRPGEDVAVPHVPGAVAAARRFREVLGRFASGVTVVTTAVDGEPFGMTCQSFASVSLDPPLVLFVPARTSRAWPVIRSAGTFCVNVLAADQSALSDTMASRGTDKFAGVRWTPTPHTGAPLLDGVLAYVDCAVHAVHRSGDHDVVVGRVLDLAVTSASEPLLFFRGEYRSTGGRRP